jgi:fatty acid desaturase
MDLIQAMQTEYSRCKRLLYCWALPITLVLLVAAVVGCFSVAPWVTNALALVVFAGQVAVFILHEVAAGHQALAEDIRRMAMLQDGLGFQPSPFTLARLQERIGDFKHNEPAYLGPYYDSQELAGPRRLLEHTAECAFFTGGNARRMASILFVLCGAGFLAALIALVATIQFSGSDAAMQVAAKIALVIMAALGLGTYASAALSFKSLAKTADNVLTASDHALEASSTAKAANTAALALFADYNCAVATAPPIPAWLYRRYQDRMNAAWRRKHPNATQPAASQPIPQESAVDRPA